jgi:amino-acid N-acetyltransferase
MKQTFDVRSAKHADLQEVKTLLSECDLPVDGLDEQLEKVCSVAEYNGEIVGVGGVEVHGCYGLLRSVAVLPNWQRRSVGETIVRDRLFRAEAQGLSDVFLLTTTASSFFERFGFRSIDRDIVPPEIRKSSEFSSLCPETAIVMKRSLYDSTSNH